MRGKREPPKKASIWETEFFISIHKKRGWGGSLVCSWSQATKRGRRKGKEGTNRKTPLSCLLLSLNSVYCALFVLVAIFLLSPFLLILLYLYSLFCKLPSSSECYCA